MSGKTLLINTIRWVLLIFVQLFLLRTMVFYNLSTPFLYVLFILILPFGIPNILLYVLAFLTGLALDGFYDTPGVHASACIALAFVRILFISVSLNRDDIDEPEPSLGNMGFKWFSLYAVICIFAHHMVLFFLEAFKLSGFTYTLGRTMLSVVFTLFTVLLVEFIFHHRKSA